MTTYTVGLFDHFAASHSPSIQAAAKAIRSGSVSELNSTIEAVRKEPIAKLITNIVLTSKEHCSAMLDASAVKFGRDFLTGVIAVGMGGAVLAEFGNVAALVASIVGVGLAGPITVIVAVLLILWGISKVYPALLGRALSLMP